MKSIVIASPSQTRIEERDIPEPGKAEVRVKVKLGGICGSDVQIYRGRNPFAHYPRVIGHEFFGIIDASGEGVNTSRLGERVAVDPVISCGNCYPCSIGRPNACATLAVLGVHRDGGFSQYITVPSKNAHTVPDSIPDELAVMTEPFSIAANVTSRVHPTADDTALIYGSGPIGLTCVQVLKGVYGLKTIIVADRIVKRLEMAKRSGADIVIDTATLYLDEELRRLGISPTLIFDAACQPSILQEAITIASPAGRIAIMGFSAEPSAIAQKNITAKELSIFSSRLNANKFPEVISWMNTGKIDPSKLITHMYDYQDIATAFDTLEKERDSCCKVLLSFA